MRVCRVKNTSRLRPTSSWPEYARITRPYGAGHAELVISSRHVYARWLVQVIDFDRPRPTSWFCLRLSCMQGFILIQISSPDKVNTMKCSKKERIRQCSSLTSKTDDIWNLSVNIQSGYYISWFCCSSLADATISSASPSPVSYLCIASLLQLHCKSLHILLFFISTFCSVKLDGN